MSKNLTQQGQRMVFDNAVASMKRANLSPGKAGLTQSSLRFEAPLATNQATYTLDTLVNETLNPAYVTQQKLNLQDAFVISEIGIFIGVANSSAVTETVVKQYTYPSPTVFGAAPALALYGVYNGNMSLTVAQRTILPVWDVQRHLYVPQTQLTAAVNSPVDEIDMSCDGFYPVEPNIILQGNKKNVLQISLGAAPANVLANSRIVIICRGILVQEVTAVAGGNRRR